jgi:hypothetical protein
VCFERANAHAIVSRNVPLVIQILVQLHVARGSCRGVDGAFISGPGLPQQAECPAASEARCKRNEINHV